MTETNPLLSYTQPTAFPPFTSTEAAHFGPALAASTASHWSEIEAIAGNPAAPTFANTIEALDGAGMHFGLVSRLFSNLTLSETSDALQAVEREWMPKLAAHESRIFLHAGLFARVDALFAQRHTLGLNAEQLRLLERFHLDFVRAGAKFAPSARARYGAIVERLAALYTAFSQNVLKDESAWQLALRTEADLAGLPSFVRDGAAEAARERRSDALGVITLNRSLVVPFITYSTRKDLRAQAYNAWVERGGNTGPSNNYPVMQEIMGLRQEQASLHGYANYSQYQLADTMAQTPERVSALLSKVWEPAKRLFEQERAALQGVAVSLGESQSIAPSDWRYFAEKVRVARYAIDDAEIKPYFSLTRMTEAMFDVAARLFGIRFAVLPDVKAYHPDVTTYAVTDAKTGTLVGHFLADNFARPTKRGGAWMSDFRCQRGASAGGASAITPIIVNNNNFAKAPAGQPTLLSADDVRTLFHEFGHGLHGLLSNVTYQRLAGTSVLRDFVELPSQLFEHWAFEPEVLKQHALHVQTGAPIPDALISKIKAARKFNQGFEAVEYSSSALVDLALHQRTDAGSLDLAAFEIEQLKKIGMPDGIRMRHRLPHFGHLFSGDGYASAYYVYLWAETLDADAFNAFEETGNVFDASTALRLYANIYSAGNAFEPSATYRAFRGRDPDVNAMLRKRGLLEETV
jgi:peptidyl-dipeptidase Dcp